MGEIDRWNTKNAQAYYRICADATEMERSENEGRPVMNLYGDCTYCGGEVAEQTIEYDYRRQKHLMVVSNVPAGVCRQCGEKYFRPDILKKMDAVYHAIFERHEKPERTVTVPAVSL
jgi:YgiT-type zinc finger domain-containing protein